MRKKLLLVTNPQIIINTLASFSGQLTVNTLYFYLTSDEHQTDKNANWLMSVVEF